MTTSERAPLLQEVQRQTTLVQSLRGAVYSQADPAADGPLLERLGQEEAQLHTLERRLAAGGAPAASPAEPLPPGRQPRLLGEETTELKVEAKLHLQPLPTGIYHLLDPEAEPLSTVTVTNLATQPRRVRVTAFLEGLSAQAVKTVELDKKGRDKARATFPMHPTLLPDRARRVTEVQWATLHVLVDILGATKEKQSPIPVLCECHNTSPVVCLARTSSFNGVRRPETGEVVDLSHYYGAWVTPYAEAVQERIRHAASLSPDKKIWGYQGDRDSVPRQVKALYQSLREAGLTYVNSVIDYGAALGQFTQRTRLPRESLAQKSANCIDGTVLFASLLEGASLHPALVLVPGHAFVGWETWDDSGEWAYLETTLIGSAEFEAACQSARRQYEKLPPRSRLSSRRRRTAASGDLADGVIGGGLTCLRGEPAERWELLTAQSLENTTHGPRDSLGQCRVGEQDQPALVRRRGLVRAVSLGEGSRPAVSQVGERGQLGAEGYGRGLPEMG
jgi:hypothetical protein